jgi:hypothetical protein
MRQTLATIFRLIGFALGLAAGGLLIALQWPDMMGDLYSANAFRHFARMFIVGILFGGLIAWPFLWLAEKLFTEEPALTPPPHREPGSGNECRHAD